MEEVSIFSRLPAGEENAITGKVAAQMMGYTDARSFQQAVSAERRNGALILSNGRGYFRPQNNSEIRQCYYSIRKRAVSTLAMLSEMRRWLKRYDAEFRDENLQQMTISDFIGEPERKATIKKGLL